MSMKSFLRNIFITRRHARASIKIILIKMPRNKSTKHMYHCFLSISGQLKDPSCDILKSITAMIKYCPDHMTTTEAIDFTAQRIVRRYQFEVINREWYERNNCLPLQEILRRVTPLSGERLI